MTDTKHKRSSSYLTIFCTLLSTTSSSCFTKPFAYHLRLHTAFFQSNLLIKQPTSHSSSPTPSPPSFGSYILSAKPLLHSSLTIRLDSTSTVEQGYSIPFEHNPSRSKLHKKLCYDNADTSQPAVIGITNILPSLTEDRGCIYSFQNISSSSQSTLDLCR